MSGAKAAAVPYGESYFAIYSEPKIAPVMTLGAQRRAQFIAEQMMEREHEKRVDAQIVSAVRRSSPHSPSNNHHSAGSRHRREDPSLSRAVRMCRRFDWSAIQEDEGGEEGGQAREPEPTQPTATSTNLSPVMVHSSVAALKSRSRTSGSASKSLSKRR